MEEEIRELTEEEKADAEEIAECLREMDTQQKRELLSYARGAAWMAALMKASAN